MNELLCDMKIKIQKFNTLAHILILSSFIASCGGGSGGGTNISPVSDAGNDQFVDEDSIVTLSGSATDSDGSITSYIWVQESGATVTLENADTATATFNAPNLSVEDDLVFTLSVIDNDGNTSSDTVEIKVIPNVAPSAAAGDDITVDERTELTLEGVGSDSDGDVATYTWVQTSGTDVALEGSDSATVTFESPDVSIQEILILSFTVTDNDGDSSTDTLEVTVVPNTPPSADAGSDVTIKSRRSVMFSGTGSDVDGSVASYAWEQISGTTVSFTDVEDGSISFISPEISVEEVLQFRLIVTDNDGDSSIDTLEVRVIPNLAPFSNAGVNRQENERRLVIISGAGSDSDGSVASFSWSQTSGTPVSFTGENTDTLVFQSPNITADETLVFTLTVTDDDGLSAVDSIEIRVIANRAPVVNIGNDLSVDELSETELSGEASDADGLIASYLWQQVSGVTGSFSNTNTASTTFVAPEVLTEEALVLSLTVTDNEGDVAVDTVVVRVIGNIAPIARAGSDVTIDEKTTVTLSGVGEDADGTIGSYLWQQTSGTEGSLSNANTASPVFTAPDVSVTEELELALTVTDDDGENTVDTMIITVIANVSPTANAGIDLLVNEDSLVGLVGVGDDIDGSIVSYLWEQISGTAGIIDDANSASTAFATPDIIANETLELRLTVMDDKGDAATDTITINVIANILPTVDAGVDNVFDERTVVTLNGRGDDTDGIIVSYIWEQLSGSAVVISNSSSAVASFTAPSIGAEEQFEFQLTVEDDSGNTATDSVEITISPVYFDITLSDTFTKCGSPVPEIVDIYFYDSEGEEELISIDHDGIEQTHSLDPSGAESNRTIRIDKNGGAVVLADVERGSSIYIEMQNQNSASCGCPTYDIVLTGESGATVDNTVLEVAQVKITEDPSDDTDGLTWSNIEICPAQEDKIYISDSVLSKVAQVFFEDGSPVPVSGLIDMALSSVVGGTPLNDGRVDLPYSSSTGYSTVDSSDKLKKITAVSGGDFSGVAIPYQDLDSVTDYIERIYLPISYASIDIIALPSFFNGAGVEYGLPVEQHSFAASKNGMAAGLSYQIFSFEDVDMTVSADSLLVTTDQNITFDAVLFYVFSAGDILEIWLPIENGVVDITPIGNAMDTISGVAYMYVVDYLNVDSYKGALETYYRRRESGQSAQARSVRWAFY